MPVNLNLNFRSKFNLNLLCRLDGSCGLLPWRHGADCQHLVVSTASASWGTQRARLTQASRCAAAQTPSAESQLELPTGQVEWISSMLTLAFTGQILVFTGLVLVKANKSPDWIIKIIEIKNYKIHFNFDFNSLCYSFVYVITVILPFITYYSIWWSSLNFHDLSYNSW